MRFVVLANGDMKELDFYKKIIKKGDYIITADGAIHYAFQMGIKPDLAIGDFDSTNENLMKVLEEKKIKVLKYPKEKDFTDTELAINYAVEKEASEIILMGAIGSRIDHSFSNIALMAKIAEKGIKCRIINENNDCYFVTDNISFEKINKRFISIIPISNEVEIEKTHGLYYPLENDILHFGTPRGVSNFSIEDNVSISLKRGVAMVILAQD